METNNLNYNHYLLNGSFQLDNIQDIPIYKFMKLEYVIDMIKNKTLWISKISTWEDVYENIIFKQNFLKNGQGIDIEDVRDRSFGQSWTSLSESDAFWRIYAPDKNEYAVRIQTTVGRLLDAVVRDSKELCAYIGKVSYVDTGTLNNLLSEYSKNGIKFSSTMQEFAKLLLLKRKEFEHEKEVRLIIFKDTEYYNDQIKLSIEPDQFIDEITLDSRLTYGSSKYNKYRSHLINIGFPGDKIKRSLLYDLPQPVNIEIL